MSHQLPILLSPARFKVVCCGRRWGKTSAGLQAVVRGHGSRRGQFRGVIDGARIAWTAPTFGIASDIWREAKRACRSAIVEKSEVERTLWLSNGGRLSILSAHDPDSMRGPGWDGVVFDEAAFGEKRAWTEVIRPALSDRRGWAMFFSTPYGFNWFQELFSRAGNADGWQRWQQPTSANPRIPPEELAAAKEEMGLRAYAQEHEAQFTEAEGAIFPATYFRDSIWFDDWPQPADVQFRVLALDPSKGKTAKSDYSAFVMVMLDSRGTMWVDADIERRDTVTIAADALKICRWFQPDSFVIEANQFQEMLADKIAEASHADGLLLPIHPIVNTGSGARGTRIGKTGRIEATLNSYLARGEMRFRRGSRGAKLLVEQLRALGIPGHDDGPDALEMAVRRMRELFYGVQEQDRVEGLPR